MKKLNILTILIVLFSLWIVEEGYAYKSTYLTKSSKKEIKTVGSGCLPATAYKYLEFNNVKARINNGGDMWWDFSSAKYEVPKGGGVHALFAGSIWVGGTDTNGQLRFAGHRFRQVGNDFYPGPLVADDDNPNKGNVTPDICTEYDKMWYVTKAMVSEFIGHHNSDNPTTDYPNYQIPEDIRTWPGNGPTTQQGYDIYLAPFKDVDGDGIYNSGAGDYPYYIFDSKNYDCNSVPTRWADSLNNEDMTLYGDATIWWVYNDRGNIHTETNGEAIGMEFRAQSFAFSTNDELNNMTFGNYQIINRSTFTLRDAYFGVWSDADLGNGWDDFVGCDVQRGLGYLYNGDIDDNVEDQGYGLFPPAVGIDFFEGPYIDATGSDELSSYNPDGELDCERGYRYIDGVLVYDSLGSGIMMNGNINGLNFGDGVPDNERWGMRRFIYFSNTGGPSGDPVVAADYYRYLTGYWKNGKRMTYGGTGYDDITDLDADFIFPGDSDPCNWGTSGTQPPGYDGDWTEIREGNKPYDRRFVQSAGPFILEPGAVNDITTGAVWARSYVDDLIASANAVRKADDKAQALFEKCFQLIDGPDAPDLSIIPMDGRFICHISNPPVSNNYLEQYEQEDYFISGNFEDKMFKFQGYQVYQLKSPDVTLDQLQDVSYAKIVFQADVKDNVGSLVNYEFDRSINAHYPTVMVNAANSGIRHTFELTADEFASGGSTNLVNNKKYYFVAIAYAHNEFKKYIQTDSTALNGQKTPYLSSRKSATGEIRVQEVIPRPRTMDNGGTELNAYYGLQPAVTVIEGTGSAQTYLKLAEGEEERILAGDNLNGEIKYQENASPINVKIVDPLNVKSGEYYIGLCPDSLNGTSDYVWVNPVLGNTNANRTGGYIRDTKWFLATMVDDTLQPFYVSDTWISERNEILIDSLGIGIDIEQYSFPFYAPSAPYTNSIIENGLIGASMSYENEDEPWLDFIPDSEGQSFFNWIRSGSVSYETAAQWNDIPKEDSLSVYESLLSGKWAPVRLTSDYTHGPRPNVIFPGAGSMGVMLSSVNVVITKDRDKWSRVPVFEMAENSPNAEGGAMKFDLRASASLDKDGNQATGTSFSMDPNDANYLSATGWSWFPGYAIDVNTGRRLNMAFGESSVLVGYNGRDMLWNPVQTILSEDGTYVFGGKHYLYVFAADDTHKVSDPVMESYHNATAFKDVIENDLGNALKFLQWVSLPVMRTGYEFVNYDDMPDNDFRVEIRIGTPYNVGKTMDTVSNPLNKNYPLYKFNLDEYVPSTQNRVTAEAALKSVGVVPNPYYAGNDYELSPLEQYVKIINLPRRCDIKIYNMAGTLVRSFAKDNDLTIVEWDLKNNYQVPIAGGLYLIHVNAPGIGEKTLKWFGVLRPDDLSSF